MHRAALHVLCTLALMTGVALPTVAADRLQPGPIPDWEHTGGLPADLQGQFPVHMPRYDGVEQLLVLSNRWVIVVFSDLAAVHDEIDRLSDGAFYEAIERYEASKDSARPDWKAYHERWEIKKTYLAAAREATGERLLDAPDAYRIAGTTGTYATPQQPSRVTRTVVGLGGATAPQAEAALRGLGTVYYAQYCYLELPTAMQQGGVYTITVRGKRAVTFVYDETRTVSRAIKVNQVGYLPDAPAKYAYLGAYLWEYGPMDFTDATRFEVVNAATGDVVLAGSPVLRDDASRCEVIPDKAPDPDARPLISGERLYELDISALKAAGVYFIRIPGVGRSWPFRNSASAYGDVFYTSARGLYHQRCNVPLEAPYTAWPRIRCHQDPVYESAYIPFGAGPQFNKPKGYDFFDIIGATSTSPKRPIPPAPPAAADAGLTLDEEPAAATVTGTTDVVGGWHDAADWDRNIHHYVCVFDLLYAYQIAPKLFTDHQLNIPESGNGVPDVLDEAEFGLRVWKRSQTADGAVSGYVETWTHPKIDDPTVDYAFARRTRWTSLLFAAGAAQYAHLVKPFDPAKSADYAAAAKRAFDWGSDPANSLGKVTIDARHKRGAGDPYVYQWEETESMIHPFLIQAKMRMAILTGDDSYLEGVAELAATVPKPFAWPNNYVDYSAWLYFDIPYSLADKLPADTVATWRAFYINEADALAAKNETMPYRRSFNRQQDYWLAWGVSVMTTYNRALFMAHALEPKPAYRLAAMQNFDYMLGANPLGMSWTTGLGFSYPIDIQQENSMTDGILDPVPGITIYGITGGMYANIRNLGWRAPADAEGTAYVDFIKPASMDVPLWRRWSCHPTDNVPQNEFTVHGTTTATMFGAAMLLPEGWQPSRDLLDRQPRPDPYLFGYYYLP